MSQLADIASVTQPSNVYSTTQFECRGGCLHNHDHSHFSILFLPLSVCV